MPTVIQVCRNCLEGKKVGIAARELKKKYGDLVKIQVVDCLDECHYPPVAKVDHQLIMWADPTKLRAAVIESINLASQVGNQESTSHE